MVASAGCTTPVSTTALVPAGVPSLTHRVDATVKNILVRAATDWDGPVGNGSSRTIVVPADVPSVREKAGGGSRPGLTGAKKYADPERPVSKRQKPFPPRPPTSRTSVVPDAVPSET